MRGHGVAVVRRIWKQWCRYIFPLTVSRADQFLAAEMEWHLFSVHGVDLAIVRI